MVVIDNYLNHITQFFLKFWSQSVYDNRLHINLGQLLQRLPRPHDYEPLEIYPEPRIRELVSKIARKTFLVYLRLSTHKESADHYITPAAFGKIVYDNYLLDVPRLMDLCVLFSNDNSSLVEKMVANVINQAMGRYDNDIKQSARTVREALIKVQHRVDTLVFQTPGIISNAENSKVSQQLMDLALYSADILKTLSTFFNAYPPAANIFHHSHLHHNSTKATGPSLLMAKKQTAAEALLFGLSSHAAQKCNISESGTGSLEDTMNIHLEIFLASFYEHSIIPAYKHVLKQKELGNMSNSVAEKVLARIQLARQSTISTFRSLLNFTCLLPLLDVTKHETEKDSSYPRNVPVELAEEYMHIVTSCLSERHFLVDYTNAYSLRDDLELINQVGVELDPMRVQYLYDGVEGAQNKENSEKTKSVLQNQPIPQGATSLNYDTNLSDQYKSSETKQILKPIEIDSLVSQVRDLLPNLGEGFVKACLEYYDYSPEQVINTILEENLPPHLAKIDRNMPMPATVIPSDANISREAHQELQIRENMISSRVNVYDGDEFDVNVRDSVDASKIHKGKRRVAKNANALLNDKRELRTSDMRDRFAALSIVVDEELVVPGAQGGGYDYDDEYDDTYDDQAMGEREPDANELENRRPFVLPQALGGGHIKYAKEDKSEDESEEEQTNKPFDFARNPEEVRQEAERKRQEKMHRNSKDKSKGGSIPNRDVVGRAKGQGQEKKVMINRKHKTENKGKHTRAAADKKMSKGMF